MNSGVELRAAGAPLLEVNDLAVHFPVREPGFVLRHAGVLRAVDGISFTLQRGETLGLVGESGCGKSTMGRALLQLLRPTRGSVRFDGLELTTLWRRRFGAPIWSRELRELRRRMQMIFQDPYASLNPRMHVEDLVAEPLRTFRAGSAAQIREQVRDLLVQVGMDPRYRRRYPHEFSGGQRQRIGIARALALKPELIVCDEPISALDVSIQAQILNLLVELRRAFGLTYVFIAHDLAAVRHISDRIAVMYLGAIAEIGPSDAICAEPLHPYTRALLSSVPAPHPRSERARVHLPLKGDPPSPIHYVGSAPALRGGAPSGCPFHPRCPIATDLCVREKPLLRPTSTHAVACHHA